MNVKILGSGGAFDVEDGNSSFIVNYNNKNYLVDCGWDVFPKLIKLNLADKIDSVCITHIAHDDHCGSLSTFIYYNFFILKKKTRIISSRSVMKDIAIYLNLHGHTEEQYILADVNLINSIDNIKTINTNDLHVKGVYSCGFIFNDKLVISGDIGCPLPNLEKYLISNYIVLHDASTFSSPVHCYYENLLEFSVRKSYLFTHHHNKEQAKEIKKEGLRSINGNSYLEL